MLMDPLFVLWSLLERPHHGERAWNATISSCERLTNEQQVSSTSVVSLLLGRQG